MRRRSDKIETFFLILCCQKHAGSASTSARQMSVSIVQNPQYLSSHTFP